MGKINKVEKLTDCKHLNLYAVDATSIHNTPVSYYVASRAEKTENLKLRTKKNTPDGVIIYSLYGEKRDRVVLVRQYRYAIDDYIYEFPAGLVEKGEDFHEAAKRELYEETGLTLHPISVPEMYEKPYFTTVGMTDESCATVYGYADGKISKDCQEDSEEIEIVLADRDEVRRILKEEKVAIMCAYMLMHFLREEEPFGFLKDEKI
ncbi:MAG: NUDIX hydrolase [Eubacteriales bacterium]|nr:NUDIX hydrolase [Eubacteriales bacterium]